jgi:hypothetical protein
LGLGWYDFHARYYDPMLGRWLTQDPALQTTNPYLDAGNSPMMYVDPDGEFFFLIVGAVIGGVINGLSGDGVVSNTSIYIRFFYFLNIGSQS